MLKRVLLIAVAAALLLAVIGCANTPPIAIIAYLPTDPIVGDTISLNSHSSSDPDGDDMDVTWTLWSRPPLSTAALTTTESPDTSFQPDLAGSYIVRLEIFDARNGFDDTSVTIVVSDP